MANIINNSVIRNNTVIADNRKILELHISRGQNKTINFVNKVFLEVKVTRAQIFVQVNQVYVLIQTTSTSILVALDAGFTLIQATLVTMSAMLVGIQTTVIGISGALAEIVINLNVDIGGVILQIKRSQWNINRNINSKTKSLTQNININTHTEVKNLLTSINSYNLSLYQDLKKDIANLNKNVLDLTKQEQECCDEMPDRLAKIVGDHIIGQSYFRFDSTSTYFPTLIFKFKEINVDQYARTSQLKIRLKQRTEDLTQEDINVLRVNCENLGPIKYTYGRVKAYWVNLDRRFKTAIYVDKRETANFVMSSVLSVISESFDDKNFSYTEGIQRQNTTKRKNPLDNIKRP